MRIAVAGGTGTVGQHAVSHARRAGHDVVVLSRAHGVDLRSGDGVGEALDGVHAVIDAAQPDTIEEQPAGEFFTTVARTLQHIGAEQGVGHIVTLSIVGIEETIFGYYQAKLAHERTAIGGGPVPATVQRATQFHEFAAKLIAMTRHDAQAHVMDIRVQPVAARTVAEVLVELAAGTPLGSAPDLAGPGQADLVSLARTFVDHFDADIDIRPDTETARAIPAGALLPGDQARIEGPTFDAWLAGADAAALAP